MVLVSFPQLVFKRPIFPCSRRNRMGQSAPAVFFTGQVPLPNQQRESAKHQCRKVRISIDPSKCYWTLRPYSYFQSQKAAGIHVCNASNPLYYVQDTSRYITACAVASSQKHYLIKLHIARKLKFVLN